MSGKKTAIMPALAAALLASAGAGAVDVSLDAANTLVEVQTDAGDAVQYWRPSGSSRAVLSIRPEQPVICMANGTGSAGDLTVDPNGFLPAYSLAGQGGFDRSGLPVTYAATAMFRTADRVGYDGATYGVADGQLRLDVEGVAGVCHLGLAEVNPGPAVAGCNTINDGQADRIRRSGFDEVVNGALALSTKVIDVIGDVVLYEHQLTAIDGPVYGIRLREQFPYHDGTAAPRFARSMHIDSPWDYRASEGAHCGSARSLAERGYAYLEGASLDQAGACLRVIAARTLRTDGSTPAGLSGALHALGSWLGANGNQYVQTHVRFAN